MKKQRFTVLLYLISAVILVTLGIQIYWNYRNYEREKQELTNDIQASFDEAINTYYVDKGKESKENIFSGNGWQIITGKDTKIIDLSGKSKAKSYQNTTTESNNITVIKNTSRENDSAGVYKIPSSGITYLDLNNKGNGSLDTLSTVQKKLTLASTIILSLNADTLDIQNLIPLIDEQLAHKKINLDYGFRFINKDKKQVYHRNLIQANSLKTFSKSGYLPDKSQFEIYFTNPTTLILKRNMAGILLSLLLLGSVMASLFWLLHIIKKQKQLAELKNDLISNITHEFKTPISTVSAALEGVQSFNQDNNPQKTKDYLNMASDHLIKLSEMVDKILETASLDSNKLELQKEKVDLVELLQTLNKRYQSTNPKNDFEFKSDFNEIYHQIDKFHFENAISNILDNGVKYGGNKITVEIGKKDQEIEILVEDNGKSLTAKQAEHIFDRFYRVPKGNRHDVKGFGIGLYYTKKIIEKHGGNILVDVQRNTKFIITLPNE